jgi:methionine-rich copper-binding protein CopC
MRGTKRYGAALVLAAATSRTVLTPGVAWAHAELVRAVPANGAALSARPGSVTLSFSEGVASSSRVTVTDGCERTVSGAVTVSGSQMVAVVPTGQPGQWAVSADVVSSDDGHESHEDYSFSVAGQPSCTAETAATVGAPASSGGSSGATTTLLAVAGVLVVAGAGAVVVRRRTAS